MRLIANMIALNYLRRETLTLGGNHLRSPLSLFPKKNRVHNFPIAGIRGLRVLHRLDNWGVSAARTLLLKKDVRVVSTVGGGGGAINRAAYTAWFGLSAMPTGRGSWVCPVERSWGPTDG